MIEAIDWTQVILAIVSAVLVPMVGVAVNALNTWLKAKAEQVKEQTNREVLDKYVDLATSITSQVVDYLNTTMVNDMKIAAEDGRLTQEEAENIMLQAKQNILSMIGDAGQEALQNVFGDLDELLNLWITNATEKAKVNGTGISATTAKQIASDLRMNPTAEEQESFIAAENAAMSESASAVQG